MDAFKGASADQDGRFGGDASISVTIECLAARLTRLFQQKKLKKTMKFPASFSKKVLSRVTGTMCYRVRECWSLKTCLLFVKWDD
jgi:hypothetical protein